MVTNDNLNIGLLKRKYPNGIQYLIERFRRPYPTGMEYIRRLDKEYKIIRDKGFVKTFHRVCDLLDLIKQKEILHVLRGSAASSLVCYQLGISDIDPQALGPGLRRNDDRLHAAHGRDRHELRHAFCRCHTGRLE